MTFLTDQNEVHPLELMHKAMELEYEGRAEEDQVSRNPEYCYDKYMQAAELYEKAFTRFITPDDRVWSNIGIRLARSCASAAHYLSEMLVDSAETKQEVAKFDEKASSVAFALLSSRRFVAEAREDLLSALRCSNRAYGGRLRVALVCWLTQQVANDSVAQVRWDAVPSGPWERVKNLTYLAKVNFVLSKVADTEYECIAAEMEVLRILADLNELQSKERLRENT